MSWLLAPILKNAGFDYKSFTDLMNRTGFFDSIEGHSPRNCYELVEYNIHLLEKKLLSDALVDHSSNIFEFSSLSQLVGIIESLSQDVSKWVVDQKISGDVLKRCMEVDKSKCYTFIYTAANDPNNFLCTRFHEGMYSLVSGIWSDQELKQSFSKQYRDAIKDKRFAEIWRSEM